MKKEGNGSRLLNRVSFSLWLLIVLVLASTFFLFLQYGNYKRAIYESISVVTQIWLPYSAYNGVLFILALCGQIVFIYIIVVMIEAFRHGAFRKTSRKK